jgi:hypothetical protein
MLLMFYLFENTSVICFMEVPFLESKLLNTSSRCLSSNVLVSAST